MDSKYPATATSTINAPVSKVWDALTKPELIKQYLFGTEVDTDWQVGSPITYRGVWEGKPYEDKGTILRFEPEHTLQYSHFSPLAGEQESPENYHTVTITLAQEGDATLVSLTQDNNANEEAREHSEKNWNVMLEGLKKILEQ